MADNIQFIIRGKISVDNRYRRKRNIKMMTKYLERELKRYFNNVKVSPMLTKKEVQLVYTTALRKNVGKKTNTSKIDCYVCKKNHIVKTIQKVSGTVPIVSICPICGKRNHSTFGGDLKPGSAPEYIWVLPTLEELQKQRKTHPDQYFFDIQKGYLVLEPLANPMKKLQGHAK